MSVYKFYHAERKTPAETTTFYRWK